MTNDALQQVLPEMRGADEDFFEDYVLIRWRRGVDIEAAQHRLGALGEGNYYSQPAVLPSAVVSLGQLRALPLALAAFFALLASATVAHALVTTVRRRGRELAILRSLGFTRRNARLAIAWQATLLALAGLVIGVPVGIVAGRALWRQLAENFPVVYVPPLALVGVLLVVPVAIAIANLLAAAPAHAATRVRPAEVLRTE
jgi:ABC-type antimicrobial peptide transport system permease subunit